jgi:signal peptidase II
LRGIKKEIFISFISIFVIFLLDRFTKEFIIKLSNEELITQIILSNFLSLNLVWNKGIAFGLFSIQNSNLYNSLTIFISIVIIIVFFLSIKARGMEKLAYSFIVGGGIGNLYDRVVFKKVVDFIDFHINGLHWFIFNVADIFITLGIIFMLSNEIYKSKIK